MLSFSLDTSAQPRRIRFRLINKKKRFKEFEIE